MSSDLTVLAAALIDSRLADPAPPCGDESALSTALGPARLLQARVDFADAGNAVQVVGPEGERGGRHIGLGHFCRERARTVLAERTALVPAAPGPEPAAVAHRLRHFLTLSEDEFSACITAWGEPTERYVARCRLADAEFARLTEGPIKSTARRRRDNRRALGL